MLAAAVHNYRMPITLSDSVLFLQNLPFDIYKWTSSYFQLETDDMQQKLMPYLAIDELAKQAESPRAAGQSGLTELAKQFLGAWVEDIYNRLQSCNVLQAVSMPYDTALIGTDLFRKNTTHELSVWADEDMRAENINKVLSDLGLTVKYAETWEEAVAIAVFNQDNSSTKSSEDLAKELEKVSAHLTALVKELAQPYRDR